MRMPVRAEPRAFTLIELLVVVSIIGLLLAITLPAVQRAREASRKVSCASQLKQLGLGMHGYVAAHGVLPPLCPPTAKIPGGLGEWSDRTFSPLARMLGELEQPALFASVNFATDPTHPAMLWANQTVMTTTVGLFLCPSEPRCPVPGFGRNSYRFCQGASTHGANHGMLVERVNGAFITLRTVGLAEVGDGLSQTIGASEHVQGDWTAATFGRGDYRFTGIYPQVIVDPDRVIRACAAAPQLPEHESRAGESWFLLGFHFTTYNHAAPPNWSEADCSLHDEHPDLTGRENIDGIFSARSVHPGGVNTLWLDGSVRFVRDGVELRVWRALGTKAGGEVVDASAY